MLTFNGKQKRKISFKENKIETFYDLTPHREVSHVNPPTPTLHVPQVNIWNYQAWRSQIFSLCGHDGCHRWKETHL